MSGNKPELEALRAMINKAYTKLAAARNDIEHSFFEDSSSRAYYGVFHAVSAVLASKGLSFSSHAKTLGAFNREFVKTGIFPSDTFRKIQRLFEDRQTGDYDWRQSIEEETARKDLIDAEWILAKCKEYLEKETGQLLQEE